MGLHRRQAQIPGQGPRLVVSRRQRQDFIADTSALAELTRPAKAHPGPIYPGGEHPIRTAEDVVKGLNLDDGAERSLLQALQRWGAESNPLAFRKSLMEGLRKLAPGDYTLRNEIGRRALAFWKATGGRRWSRKPGREGEPQIVLQKGDDALELEVLLKAKTHKYIRKYTKGGKTVYVYPDEKHPSGEKHRYHEDDAYDAMLEEGDRLYAVQKMSPLARDDTGFNAFDMGAWKDARGNASRMKRVLHKYKRQIGEEEHALMGLPDREPLEAVIKPQYHPKFGSLQLPQSGVVSKKDFPKVLAASRYLKQEAGARFDGATKAWYILAPDLDKLTPKVWDEYVRRMGEAGVTVQARPPAPAKKEKGKGGKGGEAATAKDVIEALREGQGYPNTIAVIKDKDGFKFYAPYSPTFNQVFSNKTGMISGITEFKKESEQGIRGSRAAYRLTMDIDLVDEAIAKLKSVMPNWKIVTDGVKEARLAKDAADAELRKPIPAVAEKLNPDYKLFAYQNEAVNFLMENDGKALIGDEMGLGKTLQALAYAAATGKKMLVVVPKVVRRTWTQEAEKFFPDYFKGATKELVSADLLKLQREAAKKHLKGKKPGEADLMELRDYMDASMPDLKDVKLASVNYESLAKFLPAIEAAGFDTIVVDESHRMKSPKAKITKTIMGLQKTFPHRILLSGTAVKNKKAELLTQTEFIQPGLFSKHELQSGTIGGVWNKLKKTIYIARQKRDVLPDMPEKTTLITEHPVKNMPEFPSDIGEMSRARVAAAKAKAPVTSAFVRELLDTSDSSALVFTESKETAERIAEELGPVALLHHGQMSDDKREAAKAEFQREGTDKRVFVSTRQSLAVGATLTAADKVIFNDIPWTAADLRQAEDRAHRVGQKNNVNVYWMTAQDSSWDKTASEILLRKYELNRKVNEGKQLTEEERKWMSKPVTLDDIRKELQGQTAGPAPTKPEDDPGVEPPPKEPPKTPPKPVEPEPGKAPAPKDALADWDNMTGVGKMKALQGLAAAKGWSLTFDGQKYQVKNQYGVDLGRFETLDKVRYQHFGGPAVVPKVPEIKPRDKYPADLWTNPALSRQREKALAEGLKPPKAKKPKRTVPKKTSGPQLSLFGGTKKALTPDPWDYALDGLRPMLMVEAGKGLELAWVVQVEDSLHEGRPQRRPPGWPTEDVLGKAGPFYGPQGGKYEDPQHKIPWREGVSKPSLPPGPGWERIPDSPHGGWRRPKPGSTGRVKEYEFHYPGGAPKQVDMFAAPAKPAPKKKLGDYTAEDFRREAAEREAAKERVKGMIEIGGEYKLARDKYLVVLPDAAHPGKVRTQSFDAEGFAGHHTYDNMDKLKASVADEHHHSFERAPGVLEKLTTTKEWSEGMARTHVISALNALGYYGKRDDVELVNQYVERHGIQAAATALSGWNDSQKELTPATRKLLAKSHGIVDLLLKGAGHKYLKRIPTGKQKPKYRYIYRQPKGGLTSSADLKTGAKFKVEHAGHAGHFEVLEHDAERGIVKLKHDESGRTAHIKERDLHRMITAHHARRTQEALAAKQGRELAPPLPRATMDDMGKGGFDKIEGFAQTAQELHELAGAMNQPDRDFAVIKQPAGFVLASKPKGASKPEAVPPKAERKSKLLMRDTSGSGIQSVDTEYVVMEAKDVIASHDPGSFDQRRDYPADVQERRYHEIPEEQEKIDRIGRGLEPALVVNTNPDAINGTPIVTQDGVVLGGNGRTMGMQRAYHQYPESADKLKDYLTRHAQAFGLTPGHVGSFKQPILVRRMKTSNDTDNLRALGRRMNEALTQGLDPRSAEVALGKNYVTAEVMDSLSHNMDADDSLAEFLHSSKSAPFVSALERAGIIDKYNRAEFVDKESGLLNEDGRLRVERVLAARLIPDASLLSRMNQALRQNIAKAVPYFAAMESAGWDMRDSLKLAVRADLDMRNRGFIKRGKEGEGRSTWIKEVESAALGSEMLTEKVNADPVAHALIEVMQEHNGSRKLPAGFKQVAIEADRQKHDHGDQGSMFARTKVTPAEALGQAFKLKGTRGAAAEEQAGLFAMSMLHKSEVGPAGLGRYLIHAITWEARRLVRAAMSETELRGPELLRRLKRFVKEQTLEDRNFARALGAHPVSDQTLRGLLQAEAAANATHLVKSLARAELTDRYWFAKAMRS